MRKIPQTKDKGGDEKHILLIYNEDMKIQFLLKKYSF